jgi:hypothetical protein
MTIWFYGDSWPAGCELAQDGNGDDPSRAFPTIVGQLLKTDIINKAVTGSSQEYMIEAFLESSVQKNDIVIFCCTAKTRRLYRTTDGTLFDVQFNPDETYVNPYEDERVSSHCCALLYHLAISRGATPYFLNQFDSSRYTDLMYNEIPTHCWLIPNQESILSCLFDPDFFHQWDHHHNGNFQEWLSTESDLVKKYIRPCQAHPNMVGHRVIANFIADQLLNQKHYG